MSPNGSEADARIKIDKLLQEDEPRNWWAGVETVAENDYDLAASRYKPRIAEEVPDEDPADLIRDLLATEREITVGLERLLTRYTPYAVEFRNGGVDSSTPSINRESALTLVESLLEHVKRQLNEVEAT